MAQDIRLNVSLMASDSFQPTAVSHLVVTELHNRAEFSRFQLPALHCHASKLLHVEHNLLRNGGKDRCHVMSCHVCHVVIMMKRVIEEIEKYCILLHSNLIKD